MEERWREREREVMLNGPLIHRYFSPRLLVELFVCNPYDIPYYQHSSIPGKGMSFTCQISQLWTSFCHSGDLAAGGGFGNGHRIPIRYTLEVEETACICFFKKR